MDKENMHGQFMENALHLIKNMHQKKMQTKLFRLSRWPLVVRSQRRSVSCSIREDCTRFSSHAGMRGMKSWLSTPCSTAFRCINPPQRNMAPVHRHVPCTGRHDLTSCALKRSRSLGATDSRARTPRGRSGYMAPTQCARESCACACAHICPCLLTNMCAQRTRECTCLLTLSCWIYHDQGNRNC